MVLVEMKAEMESSDFIDQHSSHSGSPAHTSTIDRDRHPVACSHCYLSLTEHNQHEADVLSWFLRTIFCFLDAYQYLVQCSLSCYQILKTVSFIQE